MDRKKDVVIRCGFNVSPREVEETLERHPAVAEAAVPDDTHGEEVSAVLLLDPSYSPSPSPQDIVGWSKKHLGRHRYPRRVEFTDSYPLGPSHKVLKRELCARYR